MLKSRSFLRLAAPAAALALLPACTQERSGLASAPAPAAAPVAMSGPALWKVADEDTTIYLFGTVHFLPKDVEWYSGPVAEALGRSQILVTELLPGSEKDPAMQQKFATAAALAPGRTLRDMLSAEQRATFEAAMTKQGLPVAAFDRVEPWFAAMTLGIIPLLKAGYDPEAGVENAIEGKAAANVKRDALETVDSQLALFDELPEAVQIRYLAEVSGQVDTVLPSMNEMVAAWARGDADGLATLMNKALTDPVIAERLLYGRNRNWAQWIDTRLDQPGTVFIAVGAGHLAGTNSVQDYLTKAGMTVTRVQ